MKKLFLLISFFSSVALQAASVMIKMDGEIRERRITVDGCFPVGSSHVESGNTVRYSISVDKIRYGSYVEPDKIKVEIIFEEHEGALLGWTKVGHEVFILDSYNQPYIKTTWDRASTGYHGYMKIKLQRVE